jgi:hypothetical protein
MPKSRDRGKSRRVHARETQGAQRRAEERRKVSYRAHALRRVAGWSLVGLGVMVGASHWLAHIQVWRFASQGVMDVVAGYPMAVALGMVGAIVLSKA